MALTAHTHELIEDHFKTQDKSIAIDATCGNGHDTEFLIRLGFTRVLSFDIQERALAITQYRLQEAQLRDAELIHDGHENLATYTNSHVDCVMFNLGYMPHADKNITTHAKSTLLALEAACGLLSPRGLISVMCYPGHPNGAEETKAIQTWFKHLGSGWDVTEHPASSPKPTAPILYTLTRATL